MLDASKYYGAGMGKNGRSSGDGDLRAIEDALASIVRHAKSRPSVYPLLRRIAEHERRLTELAETLDVDLSVVSRQVRQLEARGLVLRVADPDDRRAATLSLTAAGKETLAEYRASQRQRIATLLDGWSRTDRAALATLLTRLANELER